MIPFLFVYVSEFLAKPYNDIDKNAKAFVHFVNSDYDTLSKRNFTPLFSKKPTNLDYKRHREMAKKSRKDFGISFVNYKPLKEHREPIRAIAEDMDAFEQAMVQLQVDDLKVSVSFDSHNKAFGAYLTPRDETDDNYGYCLSSKHANPIVAIACVMYYHVVISEGDWNKQVDTEEIDW